MSCNPPHTRVHRETHAHSSTAFEQVAFDGNPKELGERIGKHLNRLLCTFSFMFCQHKKCMHNLPGVNKQTRRPVGVNQRRALCMHACLLCELLLPFLYARQPRK